MDKENKNTNLPSQGNRNLADMAQEANVLHDELGCIRELKTSNSLSTSVSE